MKKDFVTKFITVSALLCISAYSYATPLTISMTGASVPNIFLNGGGNAKVFYNVANNTSSARKNVYVAYLPPNTTQLTSDAAISALCPSTFTLQAKNTNGSSCTLELAALGGVDGTNSDFKKHLFICLSDRTTCTGTSDTLHLPVATAIAVGEFTSNAQGSVPFLATTNGISNTWQLIDVTRINGVPTFYGQGNTLANASCSGSNCITGGSFNDQNGNRLPLLLLSQDRSRTWSNTNTTNIVGMPSIGAFNTINDVSCAGSLCVAGGTYQDQEQTGTFPLLLFSATQGRTWRFIDTTTIGDAPPFATLGNNIFGSTCFSGTCIAVGTFGTGISDGGTARSDISADPLLLVGNATNWKFIDTTELAGVPDFGFKNALQSVSCNSNVCVAVGYYADDDDISSFPLILTSSDKGNNWSYIDPASVSNLPAGVFIGTNSLADVSCSESVCIATGSYSVPNTGKTLPLLLASYNNGKSWTFIDTATIPSTPAYGAFNVLYGASCSGNTCVASGSYSTPVATPITAPLIFQSNDGGHTWSYANSNLASNVPSSFGIYSSFKAASCFANNACGVVGDYFTNAQTPLIFLTNAANINLAGSAWSGLLSPNIVGYPAVTSGVVNGITISS